MRHAGGGTHDNRGAVTFGKGEGLAHHVHALFHVGGVEHGNLGEVREPAGVLLGLAGNGAGVVGHEQHAAAFHAHVIQAQERIARNVQTHLLAGEQRARTRIGSAGQKLERSLLVRGPFDMHALRAACGMQLGDGFHNLAGRGAGVSGDNAHAGFERGMGEGLVAHQQSGSHMPAFSKRGPRPGPFPACIRPCVRDRRRCRCPASAAPGWRRSSHR